MPERIQLRRTKGWRMPENTVKVDRSTRWGNSTRVGDRKIETPQDAVDAYRLWLDDVAEGAAQGYEGCQQKLDEIRRELGGKNLACWCPPGQPCHADVLLEVANSRATAAATPAPAAAKRRKP